MIKKYCDMCGKEEDTKEHICVVDVDSAIDQITDFMRDDTLKKVISFILGNSYGHICNKCINRIEDNLRKYLVDTANELISKGLRS